MLKHLEKIINYQFKNIKILEEALTHPSLKRVNKNNFSYERLEFLGDKVLSLVIAHYIFLNFKKENEGEISKRHAFLICGKTCVLLAKKINLGDFVILTNSQAEEGGRLNHNILENIFESLIGAIYMDGNMEAAEKFILFMFAPLLEENKTLAPPQDAKSTLQEWYQKKYKKAPVYLLKEKIEDLFEVEIIIEDQSYMGHASTIKAAEKQAAEKALHIIKKSTNF